MSQSREKERVPRWRQRTGAGHSRMLTGDLTDRRERNVRTLRDEASGSRGAEGDVPGQLPENSLEFRKWNCELESPEELDWRQALPEPDGGEPLPFHLRPFSGPEQYELVRQTYQQLRHSGYYWGALTMEEAHAALGHAPLGTFLIRDSVQPDVFFTLSYRGDDGPTSVRVLLGRDLRFSLHGSHKAFPSLFALLAHYTGPTCKLTAPHRRERPERLTHMCRRALVQAYGADNLRAASGLSAKEKQSIYLYPYSI